MGRERALLECDQPLCEAYDLAMVDLDGVVYIGREAVPDVAEHLASSSRCGMALAYVTNNASRPPAAVAAHLQHGGHMEEHAAAHEPGGGARGHLGRR